MEAAEGARSFLTSGDAYDAFMGRYSKELARPFCDAAGVRVGQRVLDVGCGPGALTGALVSRLGASEVAACDPSPPFVEACRARHPGVDVREGRAESLPFDDGVFDAALAQLVLHFVSDPAAAAQEMRRVVRPGGVVAACVWDFSEGMEMLRGFWDAALAVLPAAPDEASTLRFGAEGEMAVLFRDAGLERVEESMLTVRTEYRGFDELWSSLLRGIGPAGSYLVARSDEERAAIREQMFERLGAPTGPFSMGAAARCATARVPG